ncbi:MAG: DUF2721 domain-containing protein [Deltaproteobacteria bacterium]|nr:DUF2721 domain-containing protein [Deltaproteobacteria bacterium]
MDEPGLWLTPLALLPGVGLLVMSTAARFGQLHGELHHSLDHRSGPGVPGRLLERGVLLRNALVSLYVAVALLALASLVGGLAVLWMSNVGVVVVGLTSVSVGCVAVSAVLLIRESRMLLDILRAHERDALPPTSSDGH